jgi:hypothetical protein
MSFTSTEFEEEPFYFLFLSATCNVLLVSYLQSTDCSVADTVADTVADVYLQHLI